MQSGYKGLDGKTYKSFLDYRKNSEKRLQEFSRNDRNQGQPADRNTLVKQTLSGMEVRRSRSKVPLLPEITNTSLTIVGKVKNIITFRTCTKAELPLWTALRILPVSRVTWYYKL